MIELLIANALKDILKELYNIDIEIDKSIVQKTRKEYEGDYTIVVFPYAKLAHKSPDIIADEIGKKMIEKLSSFSTPYQIQGSIKDYNIVKGFLNLSLSNTYWVNFLSKGRTDQKFGFIKNSNEETTLIEFSSPNTNKPLHLGHIRNNLLGYSVALIMQAAGKNVVKVNLVNDRGIHICKSMLAWQKFGNGETPQSTGIKGDHLVGKYYVEFDKHYKAEINDLMSQGLSKEEAEKQAPLIHEAQEMLRKWETGDPAIRDLWNMMNQWVYAGFDETYHQLGVNFDKVYYESNTYLLGKKIVEEGLKRGVFFQKEDHSVWVDLTDEGLDQKLLLRGDGTSVYMTQDLGTAQLRYDEYHPIQMMYVVGNEQIYHFDVLKLVLGKKLNKEFGNTIHHLSYGMVELPNGKMKSREGTVVDADDLMQEMIVQAKESTEALGKHYFSEKEAAHLYEIIGLGALKYFILKVDPKKNMLFNPEESIDFNGNTAPFIQYTHARIQSLLRKAAENDLDITAPYSGSELIGKQEKDLIRSIHNFPQTIILAANTYSPSVIANYVYDLAKDFNRFYQESPIFKEENRDLRLLRIQIAQFVGSVIKSSMYLLSIDVPDKM